MNAQQITIELDWPATALWPNRSNGQHWAVRGKYAQAARQDAKTRALQVLRRVDGGELAITSHGQCLPVTYVFHAPTRRRFDLEGAYSALKAAQDGIADALGVDDYNFAPVVLLRGDVRHGGAVVVTLGTSGTQGGGA